MRDRHRSMRLWPLVMSAVFLLFALILCWSLYGTQLQLRAATDTRLQADSLRRAAVIEEFLSDQKKLAAQIAGSREIEDYLSNKALGMSPRYGLNANLDFIERHFKQTIVQTTLQGETLLRRIGFMDERQVDLAHSGDGESVAIRNVPANEAAVLIDADGWSIHVVAPVKFKDVRVGMVVMTADLRVLSRLLIEDRDVSGGYHEFLVIGNGNRTLAPRKSTSRLILNEGAFTKLPGDKLVPADGIAQEGDFGSMLALRTRIDGAPLSLLTLTSETAAYGRFASPFYVIGLALFPIILFLMVLAAERQHSRALQLKNHVAEADRRRDELSRHNSALSEEIAMREALEEDLRRTTDTLKENNADLRIAATAFEAQEGMVVTDANRLILRVNRAFSELSGYDVSELVGQPLAILKCETADCKVYSDMLGATTRNGCWQGEMSLATKTGTSVDRWLTISAVRDDGGRHSHYIGTYYDLSERKKADERIRVLASYDQLTGLPNRAILIERVRHATMACQESRGHAAMLFIDLDHFKRLNDTLGHHKGDLLLKQSSTRVKGCVRESDTVSRFGGDEFVVLLSDLGASDVTVAALRARAIAEDIISALSQPQDLEGFSFRCTASVGVVLFCDAGQSVDDLLKRADMAMYAAKSAGRNVVRFFDPTMQTLVESRAAIESVLRDDIADKNFVLHYQPQVDQDGNLIGAEALIRWPHAGSKVPPTEIVAVAESSSLMVALGEGILETACRQLSDWSDDRVLSCLSIAVNVSGVQLHDPNFVERVTSVIRRTGADPHLLKLEVTESFEISKVEEVIGKMATLRKTGIRFSLDDFGTGYSSLSYLKRLPIDQLKIDKSFVRDILVDPNDAAIAETIIALGKTLGLAVIAEGVETIDQYAVLERQGCRGFQGYLFGRPMPNSQFTQFAHAFTQTKVLFAGEVQLSYRDRIARRPVLAKSA